MREEIVCFNTPSHPLPFYVSMAGISYCDGSYHIKRPDSGCTVVEYVVKGTGFVSDGGESLRACGGNIYILRQGRDHDYFSDSRDPWVKLFLNIRGELAEHLLSSYGLGFPTVFDGEGLEEHFGKMLDIAFDTSLLDSEKFSAIAVEFYALVIKLAERQTPKEAIDPEMQEIRKYLEKNTHRIVGNRELASVIHRCEDHCVKHFKRAFGKTPYDYQIDEKLSKAKLMLQNTSIPVGEIASRLGYCDQHYFSNLFKKKVGVSPMEFRKNG